MKYLTLTSSWIALARIFHRPPSVTRGAFINPLLQRGGNESWKRRSLRRCEISGLALLLFFGAVAQSRAQFPGGGFPGFGGGQNQGSRSRSGTSTRTYPN